MTDGRAVTDGTGRPVPAHGLDTGMNDNGRLGRSSGANLGLEDENSDAKTDVLSVVFDVLDVVFDVSDANDVFRASFWALTTFWASFWA